MMNQQTKHELQAGIDDLRLKYPKWLISDLGIPVPVGWVNNPKSATTSWSVDLTSPEGRQQSLQISNIKTLEQTILDMIDDLEFGES